MAKPVKSSKIFKYHIKGIGKSKEIRQEMKKPLPLMDNSDNTEWMKKKEKYLKDLDKRLVDGGLV